MPEQKDDRASRRRKVYIKERLKEIKAEAERLRTELKGLQPEIARPGKPPAKG
jgi:hypothetical protein